MAPGKGTNTKKEAGRAKKAENESKKRDVVAAEKVRPTDTYDLCYFSTTASLQEHKEAEAWVDKDVKGGKAVKESKEEKRKADLARKAENARLLAEEEAGIKIKAKAAPPKAGQKKKAEPVKPAGPGAIAAGGGISSEGSVTKGKDKEGEVESFSATGIENALDLLEVVTAKTDKASLGSQAAGMEKHPEVHLVCLLADKN
jgi:hypothetical protein